MYVNLFTLYNTFCISVSMTNKNTIFINGYINELRNCKLSFDINKVAQWYAKKCCLLSQR